MIFHRQEKYDVVLGHDTNTWIPCNIGTRYIISEGSRRARDQVIRNKINACTRQYYSYSIPMVKIRVFF